MGKRRSLRTYAVVRDPAELRAQRVRRGLTLRDVAFLADRPAGWSFLGRLESGSARTCSVDLAQRWARAVGQEGSMHLFFEVRSSSVASQVAA